jgi:chaperonin GroES
MNFQPLGERVLVQRIEEATTTASGIIIPDNAKEKPQEGTVKAISNKVKEEGEIALGDVVLFGKYSGVDTTIDGEDFIVLNQKNDEILGVKK